MTADCSSDPQRRKSRVLLVEGHLMVRAGLATLINAQPDLQVCAESADVDGALEAIADVELDVAVVDLSLKESTGLDLIKTLRSRQVTLPILVLSMYEESLYAERVLRVGAQGYIMKKEDATDLILAIRDVLKGDIYVSARMRTKLLNQLTGASDHPAANPVDRLSDREMEVFQLLGQGFNRKQIASVLNISVKTVEVHRSHIRKKLNLDCSAELSHYAISWTYQAAS